MKEVYICPHCDHDIDGLDVDGKLCRWCQALGLVCHWCPGDDKEEINDA